MTPVLRATLLAACLLAAPLSAPPTFAMGGPEPGDILADAVKAIKAKNYQGAIRLLGTVIEKDSQNADALNWLGYSYRKLGRYDEALANYGKALAVDPDHRGANEYLGEAYLELGKPAKAEIHLARLRKVCGPGCEEYRELKKAFDAYKAGRGRQSSRAW